MVVEFSHQTRNEMIRKLLNERQLKLTMGKTQYALLVKLLLLKVNHASIREIMNDSLAKECRGNGGASVKCNGTIGEMTHGKSAMN